VLDRLLDGSALEIAHAIQSGVVTAESVIALSLARAQDLKDRLNCFTLLRDDQALTSARRLDHAISQGQRPGILAGVPFAAKDMTPTAGDLTTLGSWSSGDWVPEQSALVVRRLEAAGAILIGKTTTPEFAASSLCASPRWGATANPFDSGRSSGGSSGGSAVAVAGRAVPFAEGTDMGGSVRIPAAFCGVVGLKPSLGRIPMTILPSQFDSLSHFGPLARSVADAITFLDFTAGASDEDIFSLPLSFDAGKARRGAAEGFLTGKRFALCVDLGIFSVQPEVDAVIRQAAARLQAAGAVVDEVSLPWTRDVVDQWVELWAVFMSGYFGDRLAVYRDRMDPYVVGLIEQGFALDATRYKRIEVLRTRLWRDLVSLFADYDCLLSATCAIVAPKLGLSDNDFLGTAADGKLAGLDMTCPFNMVPHCPALSLPAGFSPDGLPVGLQMVGNRYHDEDLLALALACEAELKAGFWPPAAPSQSVRPKGPDQPDH
jgi:Asp-tRNA(Asn)/Glu-tRNA(Gln) amidotransferase A subunit family amidase